MIMPHDMHHDSGHDDDASAMPSAPLDPTDQDVRECAYRLYETSGRVPGHTVLNWLLAEAHLRLQSLQALLIAQERHRRRELFPQAAQRLHTSKRSGER